MYTDYNFFVKNESCAKKIKLKNAKKIRRLYFWFIQKYMKRKNFIFF